MKTRRYWKLAIGCMVISVAGTASATDNFKEASQQLCQHLRQCTLQAMDAESIDANMRQMVEGMVQGMCKKMTRQFEVEGYEDIRNSAAACMRSMAEQDCDSLDAGTSTPACREYETMAEKYSERGN